MKAKFGIHQEPIKVNFNMAQNNYNADFSIPSGGGGTVDYLALINKPAINGVELVGDLSSQELGLASYADGLLAQSALQPNDNISELVNDAGYITGISSTDIETALGYIPYSASNPNGYITGINYSDVVTALGYTPVNPSTLASVATSGLYSDLIGTPSLATVATSGSYDDLINKPTIPAPQVQADWDETNTSSKAYILNKPTIPPSVVVDQTYDATSTNAQSGVAIAGELSNYALASSIPTDTAQLTNGAGFITSADLPIVNDGKLAIQVNSTDVGEFTANQSTATTVNITVPTDTNDLTNGAGYITGITSSDVTTALGYTPYSSANPNGYQANVIEAIKRNGTTLTITNKAVDITVPTTASDVGALPDTTTINDLTTTAQQNALNSGITSGDVTLIGTALQPNDNITQLNNNAGYITSTALNGYATENWVTNQGYITGITSSDVTTALGYTPYNSSNPNGYISGITSSDVTTALGYTPYNSTNPDGYITSADLPTNYVTTNTAQDISGRKTFLGEKAIYFKQQATSNKLGFTLYNPSNTELGAFEYRPSTIGANAFLNINTSYSNACYVGFRYWGTAVNIVAPKVATAGDYYIPVNITNGNTTVKANNVGTVNISSLLPTVPTNISSFTNDSGYITSSALSGYATETWVGNQGYITGITSTDVINALGYTPYSSANPNGYTSNVGTVTSVNNVTPVSGNVTLSIPTVNNSTITIQKNSTNVDSFKLNQSSNKTINITVPTNTNQLTNGAGFITSSALSSYVPRSEISYNSSTSTLFIGVDQS